MYHIQKDIRAQKSAKLIGEGMLKCLEEKRFEEITVSDLQRASTVGRSTFYRLFDNTADKFYLCFGERSALKSGADAPNSEKSAISEIRSKFLL